MMEDYDGPGIADGLQNRDGSDGIDGATPCVADHGDALDGLVDAEDLVRIQPRV